MVYYYEDGTISEKGNVNNGIKTKEWITYHSNGQKKFAKSYKNGNLDEKVISYTEKGKLEIEGLFIIGLQNGAGFMACTLFLSINYYLADENSEKGTYKIIARNYRTSVNRYKGVTYQNESRVPWLEIDYNGKSKLISFDKNEYIYMNGYTHIEMETKSVFRIRFIIK